MFDLIPGFGGGGGHRIKLKKHEYIRVALILLAILGLFLLMSFELKYFNNTFGVRRLVFVSLFLGLLTGAAASYFLTKDKPKMEMLLKFQIWVALIICSTIVMPFLASFTNRMLSFSGKEEIPVTFVESKGFYADRYGLLDSAEPEGYFTFVVKKENLERIKTKKELFPNAKEGDQVLLPVRKGAWGFEFVAVE